MPVSKEAFRKMLGLFATGVTVVTVSNGEGKVHGMTANAFTSVSLVPPLILVCVDHRSRTLPLLLDQNSFGVNVLRDDQEAVASHYANPDRADEDVNKLSIEFWHTEESIPLLKPCLAQIACRKTATHEAGDHTIFIGEVTQTFLEEGKPLLFYAGKYGRLEDQRS